MKHRQDWETIEKNLLDFTCKNANDKTMANWNITPGLLKEACHYLKWIIENIQIENTHQITISICILLTLTKDESDIFSSSKQQLKLH